MKKILLLAVITVGLCGCSDIKIESDIGKRILCLNGHLYYGAGYGSITVYDYRTDTPTLVQCRKTENGIEYEREKVK